MKKPFSYTEIDYLLRLYVKNRNVFYLKTGNLSNYQLFLSWYLGSSIYETYMPANKNENTPWYIGNYELQSLSNLLGVSIDTLYEHIKLLES